MGKKSSLTKEGLALLVLLQVPVQYSLQRPEYDKDEAGRYIEVPRQWWTLPTHLQEGTHLRHISWNEMPKALWSDLYQSKPQYWFRIDPAVSQDVRKALPRLSRVVNKLKRAHGLFSAA